MRRTVMGKILRIGMGAEGGPKVTEDHPGEYSGLGGRVLTWAIASREDPLSAKVCKEIDRT
jgi:aldehyde:ferredoxin oxidoreductase